MFQASDVLKDATVQKDKPTIQREIINYMNLDPYSLRGQVAAVMEYVQAHETDPFDPHDPGIVMKEDPSAWDKSYLAHVTASLYRNFSKERYEHWLAVSKNIGQQYREEQAKAQPRQSTPISSSAPRRTQPQAGKSRQGEISPLAVVGVAAAVVVGAAIIIAIVK